MWPASLCAGVAVALPGVLIAQDAPQTPSLWEYGAVGAMAFVAFAAVRVLWTATTRSSTEALERERARADRLEDELRKQNALIQERIIAALNDSARAVQEAMTTLRERR